MTAPLLIALAALAGSPAVEAAKRTPVRVDADEVYYAFQKRQVTFSGNPVTMTRDDAKLTCRRLVARSDDAGQIESATCSGEVRFSRGARVVTCDRATFENAEERVVCEGNPVLRDGATKARATRIVYDLRADAVKLEGSEGRVVIEAPGDEVDMRLRGIEDRRKERKK